MSTSLSSDDDVLTITVDDRLRLLLQQLTGGKADWKQLEERTGVSAEKWRNFHRGQTKASVEMLERTSQCWPEYAFWLVTGVSDWQHGHSQPNMTKKVRLRTAAKDLFLKQLEERRLLQDKLWTDGDLKKYHSLHTHLALGEIAEANAIKLDEAIHRQIKHWYDIVVDIDELQRIREEQETTLEQFETTEANKEMF